MSKYLYRFLAVTGLLPLCADILGAPDGRPNLCGTWTVDDGTVVEIKQAGDNIRATFVIGGISVRGTKLDFFIDGKLQDGASLSGEMLRYMGQKMVDSGSEDVFSTKFKADQVTSNSISGSFMAHSYTFRGEVNGKYRDLRRNPSGDQPASFSLTRPCQDSKDIDAIRTVLRGKEYIKGLYEKALTTLPGSTFADVQDTIETEAKNNPDFQGQSAFGEAGSVDVDHLQYKCPPDTRDLTKCELDVGFACRQSGIPVLNDMCTQHEKGHIQDLQDAFSLFKQHKWAQQRWDSYWKATDTNKADVKRSIQNEIAQYGNDIKLLKQWLDKAKSCPQCQ